MKLVICSTKDLASMSIRDSLLSLLDFDVIKAGDYVIYISDEIGIAEVDKDLIYADYIDLRLSKYVKFNEILFASRHSSKDKRKIFCVHVSGNVNRAEYGGKPYSLAKPSPITMKNYVLALKDKLYKKPEFEFTLEATHHGPSEISTPSAFYEIGSTEEEWRDDEAASIVAESIVEAVRSDKKDWKIAVGVGGTHYVPRQTEIILRTDFTFGHNFAKYTFEGLNRDILVKAVEISSAKYIIYDEKSVISKVKKLITDVADELGVKVLKTKEVKKNYYEV